MDRVDSWSPFGLLSLCALNFQGDGPAAGMNADFTFFLDGPAERNSYDAIRDGGFDFFFKTS